MTPIVCIDKTSVLADKLPAYFTKEKLRIDFYRTHRECTSRIVGGSYSLVLMNISACDDWIGITTEIRNHSKIPIILLSGTRSTVDAVTAFRIGADDYVSGSIEMIELAMRIQAVLRRCDNRLGAKENNGAICFGNVTADINQRTVMKKERKIELTRTEFDLLCMMMQHNGQVLSRERLYEGVWNGEYVIDDRCIMSHIHRLRMKIEDNPSQPKHIITVRGIGYKFNM